MSDTGSDFLAEIARKVAASDAKADADLADILAGRPYHRRVDKAKTAPDDDSAPAKKPRARRQPKPKS
ncbi:MAG: hypothetical protein U0521_16375 [Anaerolineae bacterium]